MGKIRPLLTELESVVNSIENDLKKQNNIKLFFLFLVLFTGIFLLYNFIKYLNQEIPTLNVIILLILTFISAMGVSITNDEIFNKKIFKNMRVTIFFYLFISWKYHNDKKSKKYLKKNVLIK